MGVGSQSGLESGSRRWRRDEVDVLSVSTEKSCLSCGLVGLEHLLVTPMR